MQITLVTIILHFIITVNTGFERKQHSNIYVGIPYIFCDIDIINLRTVKVRTNLGYNIYILIHTFTFFRKYIKIISKIFQFCIRYQCEQ